MPRLATIVLLAAALGASSGCRIQEYVVAKDEVPLYSTPACDKVVEKLPIGHHERVVDDDPGAAGIVKIVYNGREGFARKADVRLCKYVHPELDEGADRDETMGRAVRDVAVGHAGGAWPDDIRDAIRDGRVLDGMTREQVELAWGWPRTIEPLSNPVGGERWIYRRRGYESFDGNTAASRRFRPTRTPTGSWGVDSPATYYRLPVIEERVVEFADKSVSRSYVRRYYDVEGPTDEEN
jgi:hypothetical protein